MQNGFHFTPENPISLNDPNGVFYVYNMGHYWNGSGHSGGSLFDIMVEKDYDLTSTLTGKHGDNYSRLMGRVALGVLKVNTTTTQNVPVADLGLQPNSCNITSSKPVVLI